MSAPILEQEPRTYVLGGATERHGRIISWRALLAALLTAVLLWLVTSTRSVWVLVLATAVAAVAYWMARRRTDTGEKWTEGAAEELRARMARITGDDLYSPDEVVGRAVVGKGAPATRVMRRLPREAGSLRFAAVSPHREEAELAVADHGLEVVTTALEIMGGGEGLREISAVNVQGVKMGQFLYAMARPQLPVDQVDTMTRVLPVDAAMYRDWILARLRPGIDPRLKQSMLQLAEEAGDTGEAYRSFLVLSMPKLALSQRAARLGPVTPERIMEAAYEVTAIAAQEANRCGLRVLHGLGPRRMGALVRHLYAPSFEIDDHTGITTPRDGFMPYDASGRQHRHGFEVPVGGGRSWWHATATVPRDGWPLNEVGVRWLEGLVTDVPGGLIRTVVAQHRLVPKAAARQDAKMAKTLSLAKVIKQGRTGEVSTGEAEAQADAPSRVLDDLLYGMAAGDRPTLRVTVSAADPAGLASARDRIETAAEDITINRLRWYDTRHHHGHLTTLPLGRGIKR